MGKLTGRTAVVTGASRGIGQYIAELFASEGANVVCTARTLNNGDHMLEGSLSNTVENIKKAGGNAIAITSDVSLEESCEELIAKSREAFGPITCLVNNAALNYYIPTETYPTSRWVRCFAINVHAPFILSKLVLPDMKEAGTGAIVNISSGSAIGPGRGPYSDDTVRGGVMYGASKAALERFTQGLAQEVAHYGNIAITALSPSQVVPTAATIYFKLVDSIDDPKGEHPDLMAKASLLLATEPAAVVNGRVTYSQEILGEFGWMNDIQGRGVTSAGSGYSQV
ncbi:MAG: SDR family NAD(P)-dependent oxidoreductase [Alphaproteobacteria bacterium]|jgi:NAD(P)-dependent dehydrogenase (short-subunit alcohol dehydrogenase family)